MRFGINSIKLFYSHPLVLAANCVFLFTVIFAMKEHTTRGNWCMVVLFIIALMALRTRDIAAIAVFFGLYIYIFKFKRKFSIRLLILIIPLIIIVTWQQINLYFFEYEMSARNQLTIQALNIARDYFPFGTGFATFGSHFSITPYSPIYSTYNIDTIYGISQVHPFYISDTFWPMIIGQAGIIGLLAYIVLIFRLFRRVQTIAMTNSYYYLAALFSFAYLLLQSTSSSAFVSYSAMSYALFIGILLARAARSADTKSINKEYLY